MEKMDSTSKRKLKQHTSKYDISGMIENWLKCFRKDQQNILQHDFKCTHGTDIEQSLNKYLNDVIPTLLSVQNNVEGLELNVVNQQSFKSLIEIPFRKFIGLPDTGFPDASFRYDVCKKKFDIGEMFFSCLECRSDQYCVMCGDCFHNSVHITHMHTFEEKDKTADGFCDCSDNTAWTKDETCQIHLRKGEDAINLSEDKTRRLTFLFNFFVQYFVDMVTWETYDDLPQPITIRTNDDFTYCVMLYNDEVHTFDEVISILGRVVGYSKAKSQAMAKRIDRTGWCQIYTGKKNNCIKITQQCRGLSSINKPALKCETVHHDVVAHQLFAIRIFNWVRDLTKNNDKAEELFGRIVAKTFYRKEGLIHRALDILNKPFSAEIFQHYDRYFGKVQEKTAKHQKIIVGNEIEILINDQKFVGVVRWLGFHKNLSEELAGVELHDKNERIGTNGSYGGVQHFICDEKKGIFILSKFCKIIEMPGGLTDQIPNKTANEYTADGLEKQAEDHFSCAICLDLVSDAVDSDCCHQVFCEECCLPMISQSCPLCRKPFVVSVNHVIRRFIGNMPAICPNEGCNVKTTRSELDAHQRDCDYAVSECPDPECEFSGVKQKLANHLAEVHYKRLVKFAHLLFQE